MKFKHPSYFIPLGIAFIKLVIPFIAIHPEYQLHRDEYLYLAEGHHLAWGFDEAPPAIPFLGWISYLLGNSVSAVRLWGGIFGALTALLLGAMVHRLRGKWLAQLIAGLAFLLSSYLRIHILFQPSILDIFFWSLISFALLCFFQTQNNQWVYVAGVALGLGILSKYMIAVFVLSLFAGLLLTKERKLLWNKYLWFSLLLAFIIALPNIIWQITHDFPAIHHVEELQKYQLQFISPARFFIGQLLLTINSFPVWIIGILTLGFSAINKSLKFFAWSYVIMLVIFYFTGGKDYYTLGFYPLLFAAGSVWFEQGSRVRKFSAIAIFLLIVGIGILIVPVALPFMSPEKQVEFNSKNHMERYGELTWEDGKIHPLTQDFADMLGWEEMAKKTSDIYHNLPDSIRNKTAIYCYNYGEAGALLFYSKKYPVPAPMSESSSFKLWFHEDFRASSIIIIADEDEAPKSDERYQLNDVRLMDSVSNPLAREYRSKIYFVGALKYLGK